MQSDADTLPDTVTVLPLKRKVDFTIDIPGSKSIANRALLLAAVADGVSAVSGIPDGDDSMAALSALEQLGIRSERLGEGNYRIHGCRHRFPRTTGAIDIRSAGTLGRFLPGFLAAAKEGDWRLVSTEQLARRPVLPLVEALRGWGAAIAFEQEERSFPLRVRATGLAGGDAVISAASSTQFASGLLMAAPLSARGGTVRITDLDPGDRYIDTTLAVMRSFGVDARQAANGPDTVVTVSPGAYTATDYSVPADLNAALNFLLLPLFAGGRATVRNLQADTAQSGTQLLAMISRLGGTVTSDGHGVTVSGSGSPKGGFELNMRPLAEMALTLGVLALFADAPVTMTNLAHIRLHETDRIAALTELLTQVGATVEAGPDWVKVHPLSRQRILKISVDSRGDHRVVMAFTLLGLAANGITVKNAGAVAKTFPGFFRKIREIGGVVNSPDAPPAGPVR